MEEGGDSGSKEAERKSIISTHSIISSLAFIGARERGKSKSSQRSARAKGLRKSILIAVEGIFLEFAGVKGGLLFW